MRYRVASLALLAAVALVALSAALAAALGAASGTTADGVPRAALYGHRGFAFVVSFLAAPTHHFTRRPYEATGRRRETAIVAGSRYEATFSSRYGRGTEVVAVVKLAKRPMSTCELVHTLLPGGRCPTTRIRDVGIPPGRQQVTVFHVVFSCPAKVCEGQGGAVAILRGKTVYYASVSNAARTTIEQVLDSLSPSSRSWVRHTT